MLTYFYFEISEIRERYIEEQLYSDKIRRASTWWTWGLISIHLTIFIMLNLFVEPRKRARFRSELADLIETRASADRDALRAEFDQVLTAFSLKAEEALRRQKGMMGIDSLTDGSFGAQASLATATKGMITATAGKVVDSEGGENSVPVGLEFEGEGKEGQESGTGEKGIVERRVVTPAKKVVEVVSEPEFLGGMCAGVVLAAIVARVWAASK
ncbi:sensitivity to high expression protein she9 [Quaeritorhiza haematococci]|nr:sensitivity to high expression protein she9 [Quaeritorhiza haematococci]